METVNGQPNNRLWVNCGVVVQGTATDVDEFLKELSKKELRLVYKKVSLAHLWIKEVLEKNGGGKE